MINFNGKVALVTGASGSIGGACSRMLHSLGAHVIISGTNQAKLDTLAQELGGNCTVKVCDLENQDLCEKLVDEIERLDILVCNAGITQDALSIRMPVESFEKVLKINLTASFILNKAAIKKMIRQQYGRIVNISSVVGFSGNPGQANYCASKAGLVGMSKSLAQEVAKKNVTVNCVAPGFISSDMTAKLTQEQKEVIYQKIPAARFGSPEDVASAVAFLASENASYISGSTIHVNGGMLML
jgi:3-oxoacyl-[acyl-carrier protein] reductase